MAFRKRISFSGVIVGTIVDVLLTYVWAIPLIGFIIFRFNLLGTPPTEMTGRVMRIMNTDLAIFSINYIVTCLFSILGGYIAALIAKHDEILNGALTTVYCVLVGIYSLITGSYYASLFIMLLSLIITPFLGILGGYLRLLQRSHRKTAISAT